MSLTKSPKNTSTTFFLSPEKQRKNNNYSKTFYKIDSKDNLHPEQLLNDYKINDIIIGQAKFDLTSRSLVPQLS